MNLIFPEWTDEEKAIALARVASREKGKSISAVARELAPELGRTFVAVKGKLFRLMLTPDQKAMWRETENRRYRNRVPAYRCKVDIQIVAHRPPSEVLNEHDKRCSAPIRDLTAFMCGDPPVGYSALERRA